MKLEKAIEDLQARIAGEFCISGKDDCADMKLGIEALKREQLLRHEIPYDRGGLLPGETDGDN